MLQHTRLLFILASMATLSCCTVSSTLSRGQAAAQQGQRVADSAIKVLDQLAAVPSEDAAQRVLNKVLQFPDIKPADIVEGPNQELQKALNNIDQRQQAFEELKKAYDKYYELSSTAFGSSAKEVGTDLVTSISKLAEHLGGSQLPAAASGLAGALAEAAVNASQEKRVKACNLALASVANRFKQVWDSDRKIWGAQLDATYKQHGSVYLGLDNSAFNPDQLTKITGSPYEAKRSAWAFKIKANNEMIAKAGKLKGQLGAVSDAFSELTKLHKQLAEQTMEQADWKYTFERIGEIINLIDQSRQEIAKANSSAA